MSFLPGLPIKNIFKPNTNVLKDDKTQQQGAVEPKDYYKKIRVAKDDNSEIIRSAKNVSDKDVHFYLNQYSKILEVKELRFPISEEETILIKHNADLTKDHPKRVMERLLRQLKQDYGIEEKEVKYEENDDEKIIIEKRNFFSKS
ncbi:MAG: hypothetical protein JXL97_08645, partial [Bacteroidales bacterium]|nr:hypothetical protein [Bacteroidales bacterium]